MTGLLDGLRMLIVEDDAMVRRVVARAAEEMGAEVDTAHDGTDALRWLERAAYDVIVTDLKMPGVTGMDVLRFAREHHPGTGLVAISGYAESEDEDSIRCAGAVLLLKPFGNQQLGEAVAAARTARSRARLPGS